MLLYSAFSFLFVIVVGYWGGVVCLFVGCFRSQRIFLLKKNHFTLVLVGFQEGPKVNARVESTIFTPDLIFITIKTNNTIFVSTQKNMCSPWCVNKVPQPPTPGTADGPGWGMFSHAGNLPRAKQILLARPPRALSLKKVTTPLGRKSPNCSLNIMAEWNPHPFKLNILKRPFTVMYRYGAQINDLRKWFHKKM